MSRSWYRSESCGFLGRYSAAGSGFGGRVVVAACTKAVRRRSACQAWVDAAGIHQRHHAQRLEASTSVGAGALECRTVSTAVVGECPREWAESGLSGQVLALPGKTVSLKVSTTVDTNCPPGRFSSSRSRPAARHARLESRSRLDDQKPRSGTNPTRRGKWPRRFAPSWIWKPGSSASRSQTAQLLRRRWQEASSCGAQRR